MLKEDTTGKSPENSHSRSCFCDKPVEDSPALRGKQYSVRDREWKKIRIGAAERLQRERPGAVAFRTATKVGSFQGLPLGSWIPPERPPPGLLVLSKSGQVEGGDFYPLRVGSWPPNSSAPACLGTTARDLASRWFWL